MHHRDTADLMMKFESIGIGCEFGVVQRCCGAEPLGLFRFTDSDVAKLTRVLASGLADFMTPDDIGLEIREREFMVFSRRYDGFHTHTHKSADDHDASEVLARETKKVAYLKRRFEADWHGGVRIYVHCGCEDEPAIFGLHAALRAVSACVLLWVVKARSSEERGKVEVVAPGLLRGYLAHYGTFEGGPRLDLAGWEMVCRSADAILRSLPPPEPPVAQPLEARYAWSSGAGGELEAFAQVGRCRVLLEPSHCVRVADVVLTADWVARSLAVFSVWIWLPSAFPGLTMMLVCDEAIQVNFRRADMALHEQWQQIWLIAKVVQPRPSLRIGLFVEAARGAEFHFAGWQLEAGGVPNEGLRPSGPAIFGREEAKADPPRTQWIRRRIRQVLVAAADIVLAGEPPPPSTVDAVLPTWLLLEADEAIHAGAFEKADQLLAAGKTLFPWKAELFTHFAFCAQSRGRLPEAIARWTEVTSFFPDIGLGYHRLAATLRENGEIDRALCVIEGALARHADDPDLLAEAARVFAAAGRWSEALAQWDAAITLNHDREDWRAARSVDRARLNLLED